VFLAGREPEAVEAPNVRAHEPETALCREVSSLRFSGLLLVPSEEVVFFPVTAVSNEEVVGA
jgi:hypothetical protein